MARGVGLTPEQRDAIRRLAMGGASTREIATKLKVPARTVRDHRASLGMRDRTTPPAVTTEERREIRARAIRGEDVGVIAREMRLAERTVWKHLRQMRVAVAHAIPARRRSSVARPVRRDFAASTVQVVPGINGRTCATCGNEVVTVPDAKGREVEVLREVRTALLLDGTLARGRWEHREVCLLHQLRSGAVRPGQPLPEPGGGR